MRELPILYSPDMVRAKKEGRKPLTRRPVRLDKYFKQWVDSGLGPGSIHMFIKAPHGGVGDIHYVREKVRVLSSSRQAHTEEYGIVDIASPGSICKVRYEGDGLETITIIPERIKPVLAGKCFPNGCFKEAARIWERVINVRVERLHDITEEDAIAEGVESYTLYTSPFYRNYLRNIEHPHDFKLNSVESYFSLWQSIYGKESLDSNPWVWVYETELLSTTGKPDNL